MKLLSQPFRTATSRCQILASVLLLSSYDVGAQDFAPVVELFRLGAVDRLLIDRGGPVDQVGDVNGDGLDDVIVASGIGGIRVIFGPSNGNDGVLNVTQLNGASGFLINGIGPHVAGIGDINADGVDDVMVGSAEATHVILGSRGGFSSRVDVNALDGTNGFTVTTPASSVSGAGDINGDGIADVVIGNSEASPNDLAGSGSSYVLYGNTNGFPPTIDPSQLDGLNGFRVHGAEAGDNSGHAVGAAGDFNGDGVDDFMIGADNATRNGVFEAGVAYLVFGSEAGFPADINLADVNSGNGLVIIGTRMEDSAGFAVGTIGDINRDGIDDVAVGAPGQGPFGEPSDHPGHAHILFGGQFAGQSIVTEALLNGTNGFTARGLRGGVIPIQPGQPEWGDMAGEAFDFAGDVNGDGIDDMIIGASRAIINPQRMGNGHTYIVYGSEQPFPAFLDLASLNGQTGFRLNGIGTVDYSGFSVSRAGDFNADGVDDVLIGASGQGNTYLFYGRRTTSNPPLGPVVPVFESAPIPSTGFPLATPSNQTPPVGNPPVDPQTQVPPVETPGEPDGSPMPGDPGSPSSPIVIPSPPVNADQPTTENSVSNAVQVGISGNGSIGWFLCVLLPLLWRRRVCRSKMASIRR